MNSNPEIIAEMARAQKALKAGEIEKEYALILREEQDERLLADYDVDFAPEQEMVFRRVEDARGFLFRIDLFLNL